MKEKNSFLELERFIACSVIFFHHRSLFFTSPWTFVDFFFMVTGYFTLKHFDSPKFQDMPDDIYGNQALKYSFHKYIGIAPYIALSLFATVLIRFFETGMYTMKHVTTMAMLFVANLLGFFGYGALNKDLYVNDNYTYMFLLDDLFWFTSMLFAMLPIFIWLSRKLERKVGLWMYLVMPAFLYGILLTRYGLLIGPYQDRWYAFLLDVRALASLLVGGGAYRLTGYLREYGKDWGAKLRGWFTVLEIFILLLTIKLATTENEPMDLLMIIFFCTLIILTMSGVTYTGKIRSKLLNNLGSIALPMYCLQHPFYHLFSKCLPFSVEEAWKGIILTYFMLIIFSYILLCVIGMVTKRIRGKRT